MGYFRLLGIGCRYPVLLEQAQLQNASTAYLGYCLVRQLWWYLLRIMHGRLHVVLLINPLERKVLDRQA